MLCRFAISEDPAVVKRVTICLQQRKTGKCPGKCRSFLRYRNSEKVGLRVSG
jgi:hypothetical protein